MSIHLYGIRHHGVGSARSLVSALESLNPDCILVEGPAEADSLIPLAADEGMQPPVAMLVYNPDAPRTAAWYPMAEYSPEWQALRYALSHGINVQFFDLPQKHMMALQMHDDASGDAEGIDSDAEMPAPEGIIFDPLQALAEAAGEPDGESWWNRVVEEASNPSEVFAEIHQAMVLLRETAPDTSPELQRRESLREAWMRRMIRKADKQYERVAVVCGAWHTPTLTSYSDREQKKADDALLKGLNSVKTVATFAPWTYSRLSVEAGYGAGIISPGWYHHLWETPAVDVVPRWLARVAALLRDEGFIASTAQVIDALRLSETLAGMRGRTVGLEELNEASVAVLCAGRSEPLALIRRQLIVGERMGSIPTDAPAVPLQRDLSTQQKKLRLKVTPDPNILDLDLRQPNDLTRSQLFHRLTLLGIDWAKQARGKVRGTGTFHEFWQLQWSPELDIRVIEANVWGATIEAAAGSFALHRSEQAKTLADITALLDAVIVSALPDVVAPVLHRMHDLATLTHDVGELMAGVPSLVDTLRYGDVRQTDSTLIAPVLESIVVRICVGLYGATLNLDDDAVQTLYARLTAFHSALQLAQDEALLQRWYDALSGLMHAESPHPLLRGTVARLLFRTERLNQTETMQLMRRACSTGQEPTHAAQWLEGFLSGMEQILIRDEGLFSLVDEWVMGLTGEQFENVLPLVRRTFATYGSPARRSLAERVQRGQRTIEAEALDEARALLVLPIMQKILGLKS